MGELKRKELTAADAQSLRQIMNYRVESPKACDLCKHSRSEEEPMVDRMWYTACTRPNAIDLPAIRVEPNGVCDHYEPKA